MSLPAPAAALHKVTVFDEGNQVQVWACNAAAGDDTRATIQWAYPIATQSDAEQVGQLYAVELAIGDTVPVFACDPHTPAELRPPPEGQ